MPAHIRPTLARSLASLGLLALCAAVPCTAYAQDDCAPAPSSDSTVFLVGWRGTTTAIGAPPWGKRIIAPLPTDTVRGKLVSVSCSFGNSRPIVEVRGVRYQLDDLNLPIWSSTWKREFIGTIHVWRDGWLVPAAYLVADGRGALVDADSLHRAARAALGTPVPGRALTGEQLAGIAARNGAFLDSIHRVDEAQARSDAESHRQFIITQFAAIRQELKLPSGPPHRWSAVPDSLPPGYAGNDLTAWVASVDRAGAPATAIDSSTWIGMTVDVGRFCGFQSVTYTATSSELRINGSLASFGAPSIAMVPARCTGTVSAATAGSRTLQFVGIILPDSGRLVMDVRLKVSPVEAKALTPRIRLVAFGRPVIVPPTGLVEHRSESLPATPTRPASRTNYTAVRVHDLTLLAVDTATGRVVATLWPR